MSSPAWFLTETGDLCAIGIVVALLQPQDDGSRRTRPRCRTPHHPPPTGHRPTIEQAGKAARETEKHRLSDGGTRPGQLITSERLGGEDRACAKMTAAALRGSPTPREQRLSRRSPLLVCQQARRPRPATSGRGRLVLSARSHRRLRSQAAVKRHRGGLGRAPTRRHSKTMTCSGVSAEVPTDDVATPAGRRKRYPACPSNTEAGTVTVVAPLIRTR